MIPGLKNSFGTISIAQQLVQTAAAAQRPAFELAFFQTQNAVLDRMDKEIAALQEAKKTAA